MKTLPAQQNIFSKVNKLEILDKLLDQATELKSTFYTAPDFNAWKVSVEIALMEIFGNNSPQFEAFNKLKFHSSSSAYSYEGNETAHNHTEAFERDFESAKKLLAQFKGWIDEQTTIPATTLKNEFPKIQWRGTQKELAELFIELKNKGWISEITADLIQRYFTNSETIKQVLKPSMDKFGTANYDGVYTKAYKPSFDSIKTNRRQN